MDPRPCFHSQNEISADRMLEVAKRKIKTAYARCVSSGRTAFSCQFNDDEVMTLRGEELKAFASRYGLRIYYSKGFNGNGWCTELTEEGLGRLEDVQEERRRANRIEQEGFAAEAEAEFQRWCASPKDASHYIIRCTGKAREMFAAKVREYMKAKGSVLIQGPILIITSL